MGIRCVPILEGISDAQLMHSIQYEYAQSSFLESWQTNVTRNPHLNLRNVDDFIFQIQELKASKYSPLQFCVDLEQPCR